MPPSPPETKQKALPLVAFIGLKRVMTALVALQEADLRTVAGLANIE